MGKLHEVIAVEPARKAAFDKILTETDKVFKEKRHLFNGQIKTLQMIADIGEDGKTIPITDAQPEVEDHVQVTTTVPDKLNYMGSFIADYLDVVYQKEAANQTAMGTVTVDGKIILAGMPVTFLLGLEAKLARIRAVIDSAPTLAPGIKWEADEDAGAHIRRSVTPQMTYKTKKSVRAFVLYPSTKEHPAQVDRVSEDKNVGRYSIESWTGVLSPAEKSALLGRLDKLIESVKRGRMQANEIDATSGTVGDTLMKHILGPLNGS